MSKIINPRNKSLIRKYIFLTASFLYPRFDLSNILKTTKICGRNIAASPKEVAEIINNYSVKNDASKIENIYNFSANIYPYNKRLFFCKINFDEKIGRTTTIEKAQGFSKRSESDFTIDEYIKICSLLLVAGYVDRVEALIKEVSSKNSEDARVHAFLYCIKVLKNESEQKVFNGTVIKVRRRDMSLFSFLFEFLFKRGFVLEAYKLKDDVANLLISQKDKIKDIYICYQVLMAYVFCERFCEAKRYIDNVYLKNKKTGLKNYPFQQVEEYLCRIGFSEGSVQYPQKAHEEKFREQVEGKDVAIVGPAGIAENQQKEIDSFDTVIRTNVFSLSDFQDKEKSLGTKLHVSYYTKHTFRNRFDDILSLRKKQDFLPVYRNRQDYSSATTMGDGLGARWVRRSPWNFMPNFKNMHAVQRIVWDILKFNPKSIKLFNVNFYVGDLYNENYKPRGVVPDKNSLGIKHDPLQSFLFIKKLNDMGVIECDKRASEVLKMSRTEYVSYIQSAFGDEWKAERGAFNV